MRIDSTTTTDPTLRSAAQPAPPETQVGSADQFLRLFVAQLENQNPLQPQDGADFVAQLAQFSAVEQAAETNRRLGDLLAGQMSTSNAALAGFVGKTGTVAADRLSISATGQGYPALSVDLPKSTSSVEVVVSDASGSTVKRITLGAQQAGRISVPWDGTDDKGAPLAKGEYEIAVRAVGTDGASVQGSPLLHGLIQAIDFVNGAPRLRLGAVSAAPSDILSLE